MAINSGRSPLIRGKQKRYNFKNDVFQYVSAITDLVHFRKTYEISSIKNILFHIFSILFTQIAQQDVIHVQLRLARDSNIYCQICNKCNIK
jgi:hypothetical protein